MMRQKRFICMAAIAFPLLLGNAATSFALVEGGGTQHQFTTEFRIGECSWSNTGENLYFVLKKNFQLVLEGEDGLLVITVLNQTENVGGISTRVVEEREWEGDLLIEVSRNFFAICDQTNSVFYFGEEVDVCDAGLIEVGPGVFTCEGEEPSHPGSWRAFELAENGEANMPGIIMPGTFLLGARYFQEIAPGVAMDRAEILSNEETFSSQAGDFEGCGMTMETTPLEPNSKDIKLYAPHVGLAVDGPLVLTDYGFNVWP